MAHGLRSFTTSLKRKIKSARNVLRQLQYVSLCVIISMLAGAQDGSWRYRGKTKTSKNKKSRVGAQQLTPKDTPETRGIFSWSAHI